MGIGDQEARLGRRLAAGMAFGAGHNVTLGDASKRHFEQNPTSLFVQAVTSNLIRFPLTRQILGIRRQRGASAAHADSRSEQYLYPIGIRRRMQVYTRSCRTLHVT
jgi:hypothetical protein